ncbi:hypothetical protein IID20_03945 [Patescibacteria group bacterium]|nr:hypothetical protein [Patescibacteria group bacterium]
MSRLHKQVFENRWFSLFGLNPGQMRFGDDKIGHNNGWFNKIGERLGCGDLGVKDFKEITTKLNNDELFIVLSEASTNFLNRPEPEDVLAPGVEYVARHSLFIIARNQLYAVDQGFLKTSKKTASISGLRFKVLSLQEAKELIIAT